MTTQDSKTICRDGRCGPGYCFLSEHGEHCGRTYVDEFCKFCGTSPCTHPSPETDLALAERDRFGQMLTVSLVINAMLFVTLLLVVGGVL